MKKIRLIAPIIFISGILFANLLLASSSQASATARELLGLKLSGFVINEIDDYYVVLVTIQNVSANHIYTLVAEDLDESTTGIDYTIRYGSYEETHWRYRPNYKPRHSPEDTSIQRLELYPGNAFGKLFKLKKPAIVVNDEIGQASSSSDMHASGSEVNVDLHVTASFRVGSPSEDIGIRVLTGLLYDVSPMQVAQDAK